MVLYLIGLGLGDEKDITLKGLEAVKKCKRVYLEMYTAVLTGVPKENLEKLYGCKIIEADREMVESGCEQIIKGADKEDVAFLVVGDPFAATTHTDLLLRCTERKVPFQAVHNASIMSAAGACGMQLYQFGQSVSIPFFSAQWRPDSFYDKIKINRQAKFHTLCLLDIKVKEQSEENMRKGLRIYEPPRFMTIKQAIEQLLEVESKRGEKVLSKDMPAIGLARVGQESQRIVSGSMEELLTVDFGGPLHSLVIPGEMHFIEEDMICTNFIIGTLQNGKKPKRMKLSDKSKNAQQSVPKRKLRKQQQQLKLQEDKLSL